MPVPKPRRGETEEQFISRCVPVEIGAGKELDVAQGICYSMWQNRNMTTQQRVHQKIARLAEEGPRGGIRRSKKAPKSDTKNPNPKRGSSRNKPGAASNTRGVKVPASVEKTLQKKADDFNERYKKKLGYGTSIAQLRTVYQRGVGAFQSSHSPRVTSQQQWALARVNAYLYLIKNGRPQNKKYTGDNDLLPKGHPKSDKK